MSRLEIVFVNKKQVDDERIVVARTETGYDVKFCSSTQAGELVRVLEFTDGEELITYLTNALHLVTYDDDPCHGIQFSFPLSPTVLYTHATLKKDEVWDCMLDNLEFWVYKNTWPKHPPISPILVPADVTKTEFPEPIDLTYPDFTVEYNNTLHKRSVLPKVEPARNKHIIFEDACGCAIAHTNLAIKHLQEYAAAE